MNKLFYLQLFADGGAGAGSDGSTGGAAEGASPENIIYGKQVDLASHEGETTEPTRDLSAEFENLIKGEYKDAFTKRTQSIINQRFKETKSMQKALDSHIPLLSKLADRYGVDPADLGALEAALDNDTHYLEQEALEQGLTVKQLQAMKAMERENAQLRAAHEERQRQEQGEQIYARWLQEAESLKEKYGLEDFDMEAEAQNEEFARLLESGVSLESAYKAIHFDDMLGGAMAKTAATVKQGMANKIASRASRPSENGTMSRNAATFKTDVNSLTGKDISEIFKRVERGEEISF